MRDRPIVRIIVEQAQIYRLLVRYICLRIQYVLLLCRYYLLKMGGAALIEAVEIWYSIKSMSKENRVIFAACVAISIYLLAFNVFFRI